MAAGISQDTWYGNGMADEAAKAQAKALDIPVQVLAAWAEQQETHRVVWELIAESQVAHLAKRPRRQCGAAVKSRERKAPQRPGRSTKRQRHVHLGSQHCPVRCLIRQAAEVPAGTAVDAAWHLAIKAMHRHSRPVATSDPVDEVAAPAAAEPAAGLVATAAVAGLRT